MTDLATLGLAIASNGVVVAKDRLKDFEGQAKKTDTATGNLNKTFGLLRNTLAGLGAAFGIRELIQLTSAWTDLNSRVNNAAGSIERGTAVMGRLTEMSRRTYSSLTQTAESWLGNASSLRAMGYSTEQQLDLTEALNNALVISATRGDRAASVMNAWSKAMATGKLSGDNLNTIIESGGRLSQALADSMGVSVLQLRSLGAAGKITAKDMYGVTSQLQQLREEADAMPATIQDAFVLLGNSVLTAVGTFDQMSGASSRVAEAIIWVADAIDNGTLSIERLLAMGTAVALFMAGSWVASFIAANGAVGALVIGLTALRGALIRTGVGALVVLAGELIFQLYKVVEGAGSVEEAFDRLKTSGLETWDRVVAGGEFFYHSLVSWAYRIASVYLKTWTDIQGGFFDMLSAVSNATGIALPGADAWLGQMVNSYRQSAQFASDADASAASAAAAFDRMFSPGTSYNTATGAGGGVDLGSDGAAGGVISSPGGGGSKKNPYADLIRGAQQFIAEQEMEAQALGLTEEAAARLRYEQELLNKAANDNIKLSPDQRTELGMLASAMAAAESATKKAKDAFDFAKGAVKGFLSDLRQGLNDGKGFWEAFGGAAMNVLDKIINKIEDQFVDALFSLGSATGQGGGGGLGSIFGWIGKLFGFANGGYTGNKATSQVAGVVHGGEYVFSAKATSRIGVANLEALHSSAKGYAGGGYVAAAPAMSPIANQNGLMRVAVDVGVTVDDEGKLQAYVRSVSRQEAQSAAAVGTQVAVAQANKTAPASVANYQKQRAGSDYRTM